MEPFCAGSFFASNFSIGPMLFFPPTITLKSTTTRAIENTKAAKSGSGRGCAFSQHRAYAVFQNLRLRTRIDELGAPQGNGFCSSLVSLMVVNPQKNSIGLALSKPKQANLPQTPQNTSKQQGA